METAMKTLKLEYSVDMMAAIFLQMIHFEDKTPTFKDLVNWNEMSLIEKETKILLANFLKMLSVIDFSNMSFKEVSSLSEEVETFLNQDSRLDRNIQLKPLMLPM